MSTLTDIIKNPRVTEKASDVLAQNVYTFDVAPEANKTEIRKAIKAIYKIDPVKINVVPVPRKRIFARGKSGVRGGGKKALVYLKEGDKIDFV